MENNDNLVTKKEVKIATIILIIWLVINVINLAFNIYNLVK